MSVFHCNDCNFAVNIKKWFGLIFTDFKIDVDCKSEVDVTQHENPYTPTRAPWSTVCMVLQVYGLSHLLPSLQIDAPIVLALSLTQNRTQRQ